MTARKHLKQLVRDRMRKTGERYTVARRHVVAAAGDTPRGWELRGGLHADTAAFANVLANLGVVAPHSGEPLSEAMVLGVGGGLGAGYILWEFEQHDHPALVLGFRRQWQYPARWAAEAAERLGLHAEIHETGGAKRAAAALDGQLDRGLPAIVWIDDERLGHRHEPAWRNGHGGPPIIVYAREGDRYAIDDRSSGRVTVSAERLAEARGRVVSYKNRLITIDPELVDLDAERLRAGVEEGLRLQVEHLSASSDSFSLPAWRKWARMTTDTRNKKAWPVVFADGRGIATMTASIYTAAGRGRHLRGLYADFLEEAAELLSRPALREAATAWRAAADAWEAIVDAALPPGDELRELIDRTDALVARGDNPAEVAAARWELQARRDEAGELPALAEHVMAMYEAERAALEVTRASS
jgi:hypothetical protein